MSDQTTENLFYETNDSVSTADPSLSRNSSFSKLNAQAPEFVPKKTHPPNSLTVTPRVEHTRLIIAPPPPQPQTPPTMIHVYPGPPTPFPVQIPVPQMHHHHHNHRNQNHQKHHHQESVGQGQVDKDQGNRNGLSEDVSQKIINQVEYYFSDVNLATTDHLIRYINKDPNGFVPMSVVASFKKIKSLISGNSQLAAVLRNSAKLVVSEDGKKLKRLHPLTVSHMEELQSRIIVAENLPEDHCHQNLMKIFSAVGSVKSIRTCLPQPSSIGGSSASRPSKNDNMHNGNKLHAFVEYESVDLAEKAVVELNEEDAWKIGLRVRLLHKRGSKPAQVRAKKSGNEGDLPFVEEDACTSEQNQNEKQSEDPSVQSDGQSHEHGNEPNLPNLEKEGRHKKSRNHGRGKGRGRGQHNHQNNRGNHVGGPPTMNTANAEQPIVAKPQPPGPRMPDGTRGFSMGRGKPIAVNTAA